MAPLFRRFGRPGLLGTVARTAVVAGTATMTARAVSNGMARRQQTNDEAAAYEAEATQPMQSAVGQPSLTSQLETLSSLHSSGSISDAEFASAKTKLLSA